ncbi:MAG: serine/threonine-protein kinase [Candidatus Hydrogenedentes bacterium]|nr:serine/threonine-protein kinase [Candidatus Hydrogenedentota bacterium]
MANAPHLVGGGGHASLLGTALGGYQVQALIGRGAMGTVYLAKDTALNRPVALKVLLGSLARNPAMVRSFYREAQAAAPLRHPGIVRIFSAGVESGTPYIAMEYVAGESLDRFLRRKGTVSWQAALHVGAQLAEALDCAHAAGVIHRDVKPANILLDRQGRVRLADFGIARVATLEIQGGPTSGVIGTPTYMSPEQCEGADVSSATDLYSLGVVLFQMMAGHAPFRAETPQALVKQILSDDAPRLNKLDPEIPDDVARLVAHLLQKEPGARPKSAAQVAKTIERIRAEEGGRSVVPEALSAFVREQAVESNLRLMTPVPQHAKTGKGHDSSKSPWYQHPSLRWTAVVSAAAVLVIGLALGVMGHGGHGHAPAPALTALRFSDETDGGLRASATLDGFQFTRLRWAGESLLVEAEGRPGSLLHGATGLLSLAPGAEEGFSVYAPHAPLAGPPAQWHPVSMAYEIHTSTNGPLSHSLLMFRTTDAPGNAQTELLVQAIEAAAPLNGPIYRGAIARGANFRDRSYSSPSVALHPDGRRLCIALEDAKGGTYLAEIEVSQNSASEPVETRLTTLCHAIVPGSIQYTPEGDRIVYMRENKDQSRELWIVPREPSSSGILLSVGHLDTDVALSPDGELAVAAVHGPEGGEAELRVIHTLSGSVVARPGHGLVGVEAWLPSGEGFVVTMGDPAQAYVMRRAGDAFDAEPLTTLDNGILGSAAVSRDGRWIAVIANRRSEQSVVFIPQPGTRTRMASATGHAETVNP